MYMQSSAVSFQIATLLDFSLSNSYNIPWSLSLALSFTLSMLLLINSSWSSLLAQHIDLKHLPFLLFCIYLVTLSNWQHQAIYAWTTDFLTVNIQRPSHGSWTLEPKLSIFQGQCSTNSNYRLDYVLLFSTDSTSIQLQSQLFTKKAT